jgi:hypothetical protein
MQFPFESTATALTALSLDPITSTGLLTDAVIVFGDLA